MSPWTHGRSLVKSRGDDDGRGSLVQCGREVTWTTSQAAVALYPTRAKATDQQIKCRGVLRPTAGEPVQVLGRLLFREDKREFKSVMSREMHLGNTARESGAVGGGRFIMPS